MKLKKLEWKKEAYPDNEVHYTLKTKFSPFMRISIWKSGGSFFVTGLNDLVIAFDDNKFNPVFGAINFKSFKDAEKLVTEQIEAYIERLNKEFIA